MTAVTWRKQIIKVFLNVPQLSNLAPLSFKHNFQCNFPNCQLFLILYFQVTSERVSKLRQLSRDVKKNIIVFVNVKMFKFGSIEL